MKWTRKSYVTKGADPTEVVKWSSVQIEIVEFQNEYLTFINNSPESHTTHTLIGLLGKELHIAKEEAHEAEQQTRELQKAAAEEQAAWDNRQED